MAREMPPRLPTCGAVAVTRPEDGRIAISVTDGGNEQAIVMSEYNAWRIFGMLSVMLGLPVRADVLKAIKL